MQQDRDPGATRVGFLGRKPEKEVRINQLERERSQLRTPSQGGSHRRLPGRPEALTSLLVAPNIVPLWLGMEWMVLNPTAPSAPDLPKPWEKRAGTRRQVDLGGSTSGRSGLPGCSSVSVE